MKISPARKKLLTRLILHTMDNPSALGLLTGQMGVIIVVSQCAKQWNLPILDQSADFIFYNISQKIGLATDMGFANGLSGICWGVEYLVQHDIMPGPADDICSEVDERVMKLDIRRTVDFSLQSGALGLWHYVQARIQGNLSAALQTPFDRMYLEDWRILIAQNEEKFPSGALFWLTSALGGSLIPYKLSISPFIDKFVKRSQTNLTLQSGVAGYIATHYLNDV
ncbi:MAG: hypothetical protein HDR86_00680 [Bacteroides sp.]|nr:hypothetical protein [Bacteroides sp.]